MQEQYKMYGAEFSLYSGKVRSYLRKKGLEFDEITSTLSVYKSFIIPRTGVRFIPVVQTPDDHVYQDTTEIIDELETRNPEHSVYPTTPKQKLVSLLLELYGDEWLLIPAMHYRWNFKEQNERFIYGEFGSMVFPKAPSFVQRWVGKRIGNKFKSLVPLLGISEENRAGIEKSYETFLDDLNTHFEQHDYLLGSKPCIADFGFMAPLYAHLSRDPAPGKMMRERAPAVVAWVERMNDDNAALSQGQLLDDDQIPQTLIPILRRMAQEQLPVLLDTDKRLSVWREENKDATEIERHIGMHEFEVEGIKGERIVIPYSLWMYRRAVDFYQSLDSSDSVDELLSEIGMKDALSKGLVNHLKREDNKLQFDK